MSLLLLPPFFSFTNPPTFFHFFLIYYLVFITTPNVLITRSPFFLFFVHLLPIQYHISYLCMAISFWRKVHLHFFNILRLRHPLVVMKMCSGRLLTTQVTPSTCLHFKISLEINLGSLMTWDPMINRYRPPM